MAFFFYQLYLQKIDFGLWHILRSYYKGFQCCVRVGGVHSDWFPILQGVLQGGVLSMYLYQIVINRMLIHLKESGAGCCIGDINCTTPSWADDITLVALRQKSMQTLLDIANDYRCKRRYKLGILNWGLSYTSSKKRTCPTFQLGGKEIPHQPTTVHMGVPLGDVTNNVIAGLISKGKHSLGAIQVRESDGSMCRIQSILVSVHT